jgi:hypothetical protein
MLGSLICGGWAHAQLPSVIYTWSGTGNTRGWFLDNVSTSYAVPSNTVAGQLTITELGDEFDPGCDQLACPQFYGRSITVQDHWDLIREGSNGSGGLDLTGLQFVELDVAHNGTGDVQVQPFLRSGQSSTYTWFGPAPDYLPSGDPWIVPAGSTPTTIRIPIYQLTPEQQAYNRGIGFKAFDHVDQGYLTWTISEVRSVGTPLTQRDLATHDVGSPDNGLNGAFVNWDNSSVLGNTGQNQTGLSHNAAGTGSLQWTDLGTTGTPGAGGGSISWGNGLALNGNTFNTRPADFSGYNHLTFRMKATDVTPGGGGTIGVQAFFQNGDWEFFETTTGGRVNEFAAINLPVDGQYHDLIFPLDNVVHEQVVSTFGINLFSHPNDVIIDVDLVHFSFVPGVPGDYNGNGTVDAGDYVVLRKGGPLQSEIADLGVNSTQDYLEWQARFGRTSGSGLGSEAVPEPTSLLLVLAVFAAMPVVGRVARQ